MLAVGKGEVAVDVRGAVDRGEAPGGCVGACAAGVAGEEEQPAAKTISAKSKQKDRRMTFFLLLS
jgi:hypothetical protein